MGIYYEELAGSPTIVMDREGGSAQRVVRIAWSDIGAAILEIFPGANFGYPYTASMPGFPWLRATRMAIDPWDAESPRGFNEVMNVYNGGAKLTVDYEPFKFPDSTDDDGPDKGELSDITFLETRFNFGGEYLTWPNGGVRWDRTVAGSSYSGIADDKKTVVFDDINVGVVVPTIEHSYTWNYVSYPPWTGIRNCLGRVNSVVFANCAPETLLFNGATVERTYSTRGSPTWKLEYRMSEKCWNYPLRKVKFAEVEPGDGGAQGWNHFLRPPKGTIERLKRRDGSPIYPGAKFRQLFGGPA